MLLKIVIDRLKTIANWVVGIKSNQSYWVKITTEQPWCIYYFGPFDSYPEAREIQDGYVEDLILEKATGINVEIQRCLPTKLTIMEEELELD